MFHVKHPPIEETSPFFWPSLNQLMNLRINDLNREGADEISGRGVSISVDPDLHPLPGQLDSGSSTTFSSDAWMATTKPPVITENRVTVATLSHFMAASGILNVDNHPSTLQMESLVGRSHCRQFNAAVQEKDEGPTGRPRSWTSTRLCES